jgi:hypothetical protein
MRSRIPDLPALKTLLFQRNLEFASDRYMNVSGIVGVTNLSGLWTVKTQWLHKCYLDQPRTTINSIAVLSLLSRVKEVQHDANSYTVVVEPTGKGYQWIFIQWVTGAGTALCDARGQAVRSLGWISTPRKARSDTQIEHSQICR